MLGPSDGEVLMDSTLILQYAETVARPRTLVPSDLHELQHDLRRKHVQAAGLTARYTGMRCAWRRGQCLTPLNH